MTIGPLVQVAKASDRAKTMATILLGFATDPIARWSFPDPAQYLKTAPRFMEAFGGRAFDHGTAFVADDGKAAALWLPPGIGPDEATMEAIVSETIRERPEIAEDAAGLFEGMAKYHPHEPHWYLPLIAADPQFIGMGLGAALMKHVLRRCDDEGMPAYLESSNPRNISLYERHGFQIIGEIRSGKVPLMTPMYRPAA
jgi:ribosomal protein S18 acetylase RimI-like enzyme